MVISYITTAKANIPRITAPETVIKLHFLAVTKFCGIYLPRWYYVIYRACACKT